MYRDPGENAFRVCQAVAGQGKPDIPVPHRDFLTCHPVCFILILRAFSLPDVIKIVQDRALKIQARRDIDRPDAASGSPVLRRNLRIEVGDIADFSLQEIIKPG